MIFKQGVELEFYCIYTDELSRIATVTESTDSFTKIKEVGRDKEEIIYHDRMILLCRDNLFVREMPMRIALQKIPKASIMAVGFGRQKSGRIVHLMKILQSILLKT